MGVRFQAVKVELVAHIKLRWIVMRIKLVVVKTKRLEGCQQGWKLVLVDLLVVQMLR